MIGIRTEAGPTGQLIWWTRFGDLAAIVAAVFGGSIVVEFLRLWWGPVGTIRIVSPQGARTPAGVLRPVAPVLLVFTPSGPAIFYDYPSFPRLRISVLTYVV